MYVGSVQAARPGKSLSRPLEHLPADIRAAQPTNTQFLQKPERLTGAAGDIKGGQRAVFADDHFVKRLLNAAHGGLWVQQVKIFGQGIAVLEFVQQVLRLWNIGRGYGAFGWTFGRAFMGGTGHAHRLRKLMIWRARSLIKLDVMCKLELLTENYHRKKPFGSSVMLPFRMSYVAVLFLAMAACQSTDQRVKIEPPRTYAVGDGDVVKSVSFSPDGETLLVGGQNKKIKLIGVGDGAERWTSVPQPDAVLAVAFSPDGRFFLSTCGDNTENTGQVVVWNAADKSEMWAVRKMTNDVQCGKFSPDGKTVAIANYFSLTLYETETGKQKFFFSGHAIDVNAPSGHVGAISDLCFSTDNRRLVTVGWDRSVKLWDLTTGAETKTYPEADPINACLFSPMEDRILTASAGSIHVWNLSSNMTDTILAYDDEIQALAWIKGGEYFVSGDKTGNVAVWKYTDFTMVAVFPRVHPEGVWGLSASRDGKWMASSGGGGRITIWDAGYLVRPRSLSDSLSTENTLDKGSAKR